MGWKEYASFLQEKFDRTGLGSDRECKEAVDTAFNFLKANGNRISGSLGTLNKDFIINYTHFILIIQIYFYFSIIIIIHILNIFFH